MKKILNEIDKITIQEEFKSSKAFVKEDLVNDKLNITITNLNPSKRPISAVADNLEVRNAKLIIVKTNNNIKFNLLYDKNRSLQKKIKIEQLRRETR